MNDNYIEEPKKSGTVLKVFLIIITMIAVVAAAALGLLYYNASTNLDLVREKNEALGQDRDKYKTLAAEYETQIGEFEDEIADLSKQLAEAQAMVEMPSVADANGTPEAKPEEAAKPEENANPEETATPEETAKPATPEDGQEGIVNLNNVKTLDVKPAKLYDEGKKYKVIPENGVTMRAGPGQNYRRVGGVDKNEIVTAYAEDGEWLMVQAEDGTFCWLKSNYLKAA